MTKKKAAPPPPPPPEKGTPGRKPYEPTQKDRDTVQAMTSYGIPQHEIARVIGMGEVTLRKHFAREIEVGATLANASVAQSLFQTATTPGAPQQVTAQIFWLKVRARWKEPPREIGGPNGGPIPTVDLSKATPEQLDALQALFGPLAGEPGDDDGGDPGGEGQAGA